MSSGMDFLSERFEELEIGHREDADDDSSSSICGLPGEIILQILNKLLDLKTLCCCYLVSKQFSSIVVQVDAITFNAPLLFPKPIASTPILSLQLYLKSVPFRSACSFLFKFRGVKSLCIQLPFSSHDGVVDNRCLFKWKVQYGRRMHSAIFLSPSSIVDKDGFCLNETGYEEDEDYEKARIFIQCIKDWEAWKMIWLECIKNLTTLEQVSITDSWRRGRVSLSGEKLREVKESVEVVESSGSISDFYIPVLELPVSGYVMKGVCVWETIDHLTGIDGLMSDDGFEGREEVAYSEALEVIYGCKRVLLV